MTHASPADSRSGSSGRPTTVGPQRTHAGIAGPPNQRVAVVADFAEEDWPSMERVADGLVSYLPGALPDGWGVTKVQPRMWAASSGRVPGAGSRLMNRFVRYGVHLLSRRGDFDLFHLADHSYAHLVQFLPKGRTVVTCHDLDTFASIMVPAKSSGRGKVFRWMTNLILKGLRSAAHVFCVSAATRDALLEARLLPADRVSVTPNGLDPIFFNPPDPESESAFDDRLRAAHAPDRFDLLHVGSNIPRKRLDVLLETFARVRRALPGARLLRIGAPWTPPQAALARSLGVEDAITVLPRLPAGELATAYRRARLLLQTSEAEGFGLPVAEAMASGLPVLASGISALREVGGLDIEFAPVGDSEVWARQTLALLQECSRQPERWGMRQDRGRARAESFRWEHTAKAIAEVYQDLVTSPWGDPKVSLG